MAAGGDGRTQQQPSTRPHKSPIGPSQQIHIALMHYKHMNRWVSTIGDYAVCGAYTMKAGAVWLATVHMKERWKGG